MRYPKFKTGSSKYNAKKIIIDNMQFDSSKEANRYCELRLLQRAGEIRDLKCQVPFELIPSQREPDTVGPRGGVKKGKVIEQSVIYRADFTYYDSTGKYVVEDVKGYTDTASAAYAKYVIKRKLMLYRYGIRIQEI